MKGFFRRLLNILPWITFLAALFYIFSLNFRPDTRMDYLQRGVLDVVAPISKSFQLTVQGSRGSTRNTLLYARLVRPMPTCAKKSPACKPN